MMTSRGFPERNKLASPLFILLLFLLSLNVPSQAAINQADLQGVFSEVDRLAAEQKLQAALDKLIEYSNKPSNSLDDQAQAEIMIRLAKLRIGLHGFETAVRELKSSVWPQKPEARILVELYYAFALKSYFQTYSWEIRGREKTVTQNQVDLKAWTTEQIGNEIAKSFDKVISTPANQKVLANPPPDSFGVHFSKNNYPAGVRPTLRDAVTYLAVEHMRNSQYWSPDQSANSYLVKLDENLESLKKRFDAADETLHPLLRIASWLIDLEAFHSRAGNLEAALESRYVLYEVFYGAQVEEIDRTNVRERLTSFQEKNQSLPWWSRGQALLADLTLESALPGTRIRAREIAQNGKEKHPKSYGGTLCEVIIHEIEMPAYNVTSMGVDLQSDKSPNNSLVLNYKNLQRMYFRAYKVNLAESLKRKFSGGDPLLDDEFLNSIRNSSLKPVSEWNVPLQATPDFSYHRKLVAPKLPGPGAYVIVSSSKADFSTAENITYKFGHLNSNLVLSVNGSERSRVEIRALSGDSGIPAPKVAVSLFRYQWNRPPELVETKTSDLNGYAVFQQPKSLMGEYWNYFVYAVKDSHESLLINNIYFASIGEENDQSSALVYTDRSVYRPQQKVFFKIVAYSGSARRSSLKTSMPGEILTVRLIDPNNKVVVTKSLKTSAFGTASGEFIIPAGRPLGSWLVDSIGSHSGRAQIKVEEYKRPSFETKISEAVVPLRLNKKAVFKGEAKYYFGLPVSQGAVRWRISRVPRMPFWWSYYGWSWWQPPSPPQTIATGKAALNKDGTFEIAFTPAADERLASNPNRAKDISYDFEIEANVTDEGGETRSLEKSFRIGFHTLESRLDFVRRFSLVNEKVDGTVQVSSLSGQPRSVSGHYKLIRVQQPSKTPLPADFSRDPRLFSVSDPTADNTLPKHSDDEVRARWETDFRWESIAASWPEGEIVASGKVKTDDAGAGKIAIGRLSQPGVYKLIFECKDDFGSPISVSRNFLVASVKKTNLAFPLVMIADKSSYEVGETAKVLLHTGLNSQKLTLEIYQDGTRVKRYQIDSTKSESIIDVPISLSSRGGLTLFVSGIRDHQVLSQELNLEVPWRDRELNVKYSTFRDQLRPGTKESFRVTIADQKGKPVGKGESEVLAYMYDRSLDLFWPHKFPSILSLYPVRFGAVAPRWALGSVEATHMRGNYSLRGRPSSPSPDQLTFFANYGVGGPGSRRGFYATGHFEEASLSEDAAPSNIGGFPGGAVRGRAESKSANKMSIPPEMKSEKQASADASQAKPDVHMRSEFSETAFFFPHLVTDKNGAVGFEFQVPDSVTSWQVFAHALTKEMRGGSETRETRSVKELMVRTYAPRFLREGDDAEIRVAVNNASAFELNGDLVFDLEDPITGKSVLKEFGIERTDVKRSFRIEKSGTVTFSFQLKAPRNVGQYAFKVIATGKQKLTTFSDGERRAFPILPGRLHLAQSRFVTLKNKSTKVMTFEDLAKADDPSLLQKKMVVTVDAQLFYGVLRALPYLIKYPYECTEQTLNRFLSTGIMTSLFKKYPAIEKMAREMSKRKEQLERVDDTDANRRMALEETPWLEEAQGGRSDDADSILNVLDSNVANTERERALEKLKKMQLPSGGFPWFEGGPADKYMTLYLLMGFGRAQEFKIDVPKDMVVKAWTFVRNWLDSDLDHMIQHNCCHEFITLINFAVSQYSDESWTGGLFDNAFRARLLEYSFGNWKGHSPLLKGYLALTLKRMKRDGDAKLVWDSVMDSAKSNDKEGTFWAQEDRSWLWYNDTIESHAFSIRALLEIEPQNQKLDGLVQWLFLNKKLNHWKSTRATAESIYSLAHFLDKTATLGVREEMEVDLGNQKTSFIFESDKYSGRKNQIVIEGEKISPISHSRIKVSKTTPGFAFASAVWHFSTEELPKEDKGDFFRISRRYFKRENNGKEWLLKPINEGDSVRVGDQIEVQISIRLKHAAEYVHLRDPRAAGLEPENVRSGYRYDLGISWYEETRDSGTNFFFSSLPVGEYNFKYRLRANMAGHFRTGPASIQSIYAPEFNAYSAGAKIKVRENEKR
jgi:uncharacterized protein YfaS (alpha-2-macroglobulin family)